MGTRRNFIQNGLTGMAAISVLPAVNTFAAVNNNYNRHLKAKPRLRFALVSDGHYGEPNTDSKTFYADMVKWLNTEHKTNNLDFIIVNGDLVHDRTELLAELKADYLDKLVMPYYTLPGNHDHADAALWKKVFGYEDNYTIDKGNTAFVLANTADTAGKYVCPDMDFIKQSLDDFKDKKTVLVILHISPVKWFKNDVFMDCPELMELLESYPNVKALFHGHDHTIDNMRRSAKLPHFFDSHIGGSWGTDYKGYRVVEIDSDDHIYTYQVNASQNPVLNSNKL